MILTFRAIALVVTAAATFGAVSGGAVSFATRPHDQPAEPKPGSPGWLPTPPGVSPAMFSRLEKDFVETKALLGETRTAVAEREKEAAAERERSSARVEELEKLLARCEKLLREQGETVARLQSALDEARKEIDVLKKFSTIANMGAEVPKIDALVFDVQAGGIVILSKGETDGVKPGYQFTVVRDGKPIGRLVAEDVDESFTAARVDVEDARQPIKRGDFVTTKFAE